MSYSNPLSHTSGSAASRQTAQFEAPSAAEGIDPSLRELVCRFTDLMGTQERVGEASAARDLRGRVWPARGSGRGGVRQGGVGRGASTTIRTDLRGLADWCDGRRIAAGQSVGRGSAWGARQALQTEQASSASTSGSDSAAVSSSASGPVSLDDGHSSALCVSASSSAQGGASLGSTSTASSSTGGSERPWGPKRRAWQDTSRTPPSRWTGSADSSRGWRASGSSDSPGSIGSPRTPVSPSSQSSSSTLTVSSIELQDCSSEVTHSDRGPLLWDRSSLHADDIHALIHTRLGGHEGLLTGGKDGRVIFTTIDGSHSGQVIEAPRGRGQHWVTALAANEVGQLALGRRSGSASLFDLTEEVRHVAEAACTAVGNSHAKVRNQDRIHSMTWVSAVEGESAERVLIAGLNGRMLRLDGDLRTLARIECDPLAWVYGGVELDPNHLLFIEGAGLAMHTFRKGRWTRQESYMAKMHGDGNHGLSAEARHAGDLLKGQRLISHIYPVPQRPQEVVISQFDGSVSQLDLHQEARIRTTTIQEVSSWVLNDYGTSQQMSRRVWQALPLEGSVWVAATDDGTLPLIDWRTRRVAQRLSLGGERVSCLAVSPDSHVFFAVSCATDPRASQGAHLQAFDTRRA